MKYKSSKFILFIILGAFLFRGLFLVAVFPIFKGQDESRHYNTVQYLANNKKKDCQKNTGEGVFANKQDKQDLSTYRYSDEIRETALISQTKQVRGNYYDKVAFTNNLNGLGEKKFKQIQHSKIQHFCPPDVANSVFNKDGLGIYHKSLMRVENLLINKNIFIRYDALRIISVLLGIIFLYLAYRIFNIVGFSKKQSLILVTIISFQPKLAIYFTNINYDVFLIPLWTGFVLVGVWILKSGWSFWRSASLLMVFILGMITKPTAVSLLGLGMYLIVYGFWINRKQIKKRKILLGGIGIIFIVGVYLLLQRVGILRLFTAGFLNNLGIYLGKSFSKIHGSSRDYWGAIGWSGSIWPIIYVGIIWLIEWVAWLGLGVFITCLWIKNFAKVQPLQSCKGWTFAKLQKQKKYFWFMLASILALQVGVRLADWKVFVESGSLVLGTPGRYWLPNIVPHFVLLAMGLKSILGFLKSRKLQEKYFELSLLMFLVLMILYWSYEVFNIIIPRFYL